MNTIGYAYYLRIKVKPEKRSNFVELILKLRDDALREIDGVVLFELLETKMPCEFVIMQGFTDRDAYRRYANAPFHLEMAPHGLACVEGEPHIEALVPLGVGRMPASYQDG